MQFYSTDTQFFPVVSGLRAFPKMCVGTREFCESRFRHPRLSGWAWELRGRMQVKGTELEPAGEPRYTSIFRFNLRLLIVFSLRNAHEFPLDGFARTGGAGRWGASTAPQFAFKMRGVGRNGEGCGNGISAHLHAHIRERVEAIASSSAQNLHTNSDSNHKHEAKTKTKTQVLQTPTRTQAHR